MSRFVSAGTDEAPTPRDEAWQKAQAEIEAKRQQSTPSSAPQGSEKSLYETLQANKAAKQEAFEEAARLRNQFRSLDEDEVEFLDGVLEGERERERRLREAERKELEAFRRRQESEVAVVAKEGVEGGKDEGVDEGGDVVWSAAGKRKRRKGREGVLGGVKIRRTSESVGQKDAEVEAGFAKATSPKESEEVRPAGKKSGGEAAGSENTDARTTDGKTSWVSVSPPPAAALGLAAYSSDEDD